MAGNRWLRNLKRVVLQSPDSGLVRLQFTSQSRKSFAEHNKFGHTLIRWLVAPLSSGPVSSQIVYGPREVGAESVEFDERAEFVEQRSGIVRAGRGFRMILHAENRLGLVSHSFNGLIVEIEAVHRHIGGKGVGINGEAMILSRDFDLAGLQVFDGLVRAPLAEFQFEGLATKCLAENLVAQADSENRNAALHQIIDGLHRIVER